MTRAGVIAQKYGEHVEARPFSIFTQDETERFENDRWFVRASVWGAKHVDRWGHWDGQV